MTSCTRSRRNRVAAVSPGSATDGRNPRFEDFWSCPRVLTSDSYTEQPLWLLNVVWYLGARPSSALWVGLCGRSSTRLLWGHELSPQCSDRLPARMRPTRHVVLFRSSSAWRQATIHVNHSEQTTPIAVEAFNMKVLFRDWNCIPEIPSTESIDMEVRCPTRGFCIMHSAVFNSVVQQIQQSLRPLLS